MLVVDTIAKIRRAYFSQKKTIKEICRELGISRKVVRKVIRTGATEFRYERTRQPMPRLWPWRERLDGLLKANAPKAARERLTLVRIFEELQGLGFGGSYAAVWRYALRWGEEHASATAPAYIPLSFAPGEAYQFDWSHEIVVLNGATVTVTVTVTVKVAHARLCHSRLSHYFHTDKADGPVDRKLPTQVGRALERLGVEHIAAYSPQARGRSERLFQTLQDRLVKEPALAGIETVEAANAFLAQVYIPAHNARFAIGPEQPGTGFVAIPGVDLDEVLCVQEERLVGNDNCVSYNRLRLQIPESPRSHEGVAAAGRVS